MSQIYSFRPQEVESRLLRLRPLAAGSRISAKEGQMNVALVLVSLGIANAPEPVAPLMLAYFDDMTSCVAAAKQAELPVAGTPGRSTRGRSLCACLCLRKEYSSSKAGDD
jgi:hypothetical protein